MNEVCVSALRKFRVDEAWRSYMADGLYVLVNRYGPIYSGRFSEVISPKSEADLQKIAEENKERSKKIVSDIRNKLKGD